MNPPKRGTFVFTAFNERNYLPGARQCQWGETPPHPGESFVPGATCPSAISQRPGQDPHGCGANADGAPFFSERGMSCSVLVKRGGCASERGAAFTPHPRGTIQRAVSNSFAVGPRRR